MHNTGQCDLRLCHKITLRPLSANKQTLYILFVYILSFLCAYTLQIYASPSGPDKKKKMQNFGIWEARTGERFYQHRRKDIPLAFRLNCSRALERLKK